MGWVCWAVCNALECPDEPPSWVLKQTHDDGALPLMSGACEGRLHGEGRLAADARLFCRRCCCVWLAAVGPELPGLAAAAEPVVQRAPLGDAHAAVCAHTGVPLAGEAVRASRFCRFQGAFQVLW